MTELLSRRDAIRRGIGIGAGAIAAASSARITQAQAAPSALDAIPTWGTEFKQLAPHVYSYVQAGGPSIPYSGIANAGIIEGTDSLIAFDSLAAPLQTKAFLAAVKSAFPSKPISRLIYSHHHGDHIDGAEFFPPVELVGTEFCREAILAMKPLPPWEKRAGWADGGEKHDRLPPTTIFEKNLTYHNGTTVAQLMEVSPAHTYGDLIVYLPQEKVIFAGDVAFFYIAPYAHWANITNWINVSNKILDMDVNVIVPGHGPLGGKKELAAMRDYLILFQKEARKRYDAGMTPGKAAASISMGRFDSWLGARDRLAMNTVRAFHEFSGTLVPEMDVDGTAAANKEFAGVTGYMPQP